MDHCVFDLGSQQEISYQGSEWATSEKTGTFGGRSIPPCCLKPLVKNLGEEPRNTPNTRKRSHDSGDRLR
jgi:hypothetical protein